MDPADPAVATPKPPPAWDRLLVVVVSLEPWCESMISAACDRGEFDVRTITRDGQSLERLLNLAPAVIVVDVTGGDRTPFDLLRALQARAETQSIPTLAVGASPDPLVRAATFSAGAEDFTHRGCDPTELTSRLRTLARLSAATARGLAAEAALQRVQQRLRERERQVESANTMVDHVRDALQADNREQRSRVESMVQVGMELHRVHDTPVLLDRILSEARRLIHADAGTVFLREHRVLRFAFAQNDTLARRDGGSGGPGNLFLAVDDQSIAGWVAASGETVLEADAYHIEPS
ncbi:MAG: response regulator, partial [Phycisphaerales bacterium]